MEAVFYDRLMQHFDTDRNGVLDKTEWMMMLSSLDTSNTQSPEDWSAVFDVIDGSEDHQLRTCGGC